MRKLIFVELTLVKCRVKLDIGYNGTPSCSVFGQSIHFFYGVAFGPNFDYIYKIPSLSSFGSLPSNRTQDTILFNSRSFQRVQGNQVASFLSLLLTLLILAIFQTSIFVLFAVHVTLNILLKNHIFPASSLFLISYF